MPNRASAFKVRAYQLFRSGVPLREIAEKVGCSRSLVYRWSKQENWTSPLQSSLAPIESAALKIQDGDATAGLTEVLRSKIPDRLAELEELCKKGNVTAILAWIKYTGMQPPKPEAAEPKAVMPIFKVDLRVKNGNKKPTLVDAEPVPKPIALPETIDEPGNETGAITEEAKWGDIPESHPM